MAASPNSAAAEAGPADRGEPQSGHVYLSYAAEDARLVEFLARELNRRGIRYQRIDTGPTANYMNEPRAAAVAQAAAVIVVWSRNSVSSPWVVDEAALAGDKLVSVPLTGPSDIPSRFQGFQTIDLAGWTGDPSDSRLELLAAALRDMLGRHADADGAASAPGSPSPDGSLPGEPALPGEPYSFSENALQVVQLAAERTGGRPPDASDMLLSALLHVRMAAIPGVAGVLLSMLADRQPGGASADDFLRPVRAAFPPAEIPQSGAGPDVGRLMTDPPLSALLDLAARCATRLLGRAEIHTRHLLAAALLADGPPLARELLDKLHASRTELRRMLLQALRESATGEPGTLWEIVLLAPPDRLAGGISTDLVNPNGVIPLAEDDLGFGVWASMFATVIADRNTPMPVSVGLFGEWGSGKSYFMGLLRSEIRRLCDSGQAAYLNSSDVVQIGFNAWHYADTNLWASLGDEIFRQLADAPATPAQIREEVRGQIASGRAAQEELEKLADHARLEKEQRQAEVRAASEDRQVSARDLLDAAAQSPELNRDLARVWRRLGVSDPAEQARLLADQMRGTTRDAGELRGLFLQRRTWVMAVICLIALLVTVAGVFIPAGWSTRLWAGGAVSTVTLVLTFAVAVAGGVSSGLRHLREVAADIARRAEAAADKRSGIAAKREQLKAAEAEADKAQARLRHATAHVAELERQFAELLPEKRLYAFLAERAASGDYASQLGLISLIRKDFGRLATLINDQDPDGETADGAGSRRIRRIVLYIDDLDRCRSGQVVDVLQAVHLLLALDLFVVVVGVDPRWLLRSLRDQYPGTLGDGGRQDQDGRALADVPPAGYLEKIFNIPFVLPGVPQDGLGHLVRRLAAASAPRAAGAAEAAGTARAAAAVPASRSSQARRSRRRRRRRR